MKRSLRPLGLAAGVAAVLGMLALPAQPAAAQSITTVDGVVKMNTAGGETATDGLEVWVGPGNWNVKRNGKWQVFSYAVDGGEDPDHPDYSGETIGEMQIGLYYNGRIATVGEFSWGDLIGDNVDLWDQMTLDLTDGSAPNYQAVSLLAAQFGPLTMPLIVTTTYTAPNEYFDVTMTLGPYLLDSPPPSSPRGGLDMQLYFAGDMYLDGSDEGPGIESTDPDGNLLIGQYNATAFGGYAELPGSTWDSWMEGDYTCVFGYWDSDVSEGCQEGPYTGAPYSNTVDPNPSFEEGSGTDAGVGAHWTINAAEATTRAIRVYFTDSSRFLPAEAPLQCELTPDMAVNPQFIELLPNGTARVEVTLRNLCKDAPYNGSDLLLSVNDQLRVIDGSRELVFLGSRAAVQGLSLNPDETRTYFFIVQAGDVVPAGPVHISELYNSGRVVQRIDGVFLTPAPAPTAEPASAPAPAAPAAAAPAPLPNTLPNTAGESAPLGVPVAVLLIAALIGLSGWRLAKVGRRG